MLIKCEECGNNISDKAYACPMCGFPLKQGIPTLNQWTRKKRMRLPNGFGEIYEIKGRNLRNPFRVRVPMGVKENGRPQLKQLKPTAYFKTYNEAYAALVNYHKNPYDLDSFMSLDELYDIWSERHFKKLSDSGISNIKAAWRYCFPLYNMQVRDIRPHHLECLIEDAYVLQNDGKTVKMASSETKKRMKSLLNQMYDYACKNEIADKNYSRMFNLEKEILEDANTATNTHIAFSEEELDILWANRENMKDIDFILIQCYGGWRPQELSLILTDNVDLDKWECIAGIKTDAGTDRKVPIHPRIRNIVKEQYDFACSIGSKYLLNTRNNNDPSQGSRLTYRKYSSIFSQVVKELHLNQDHRPHDGRKTFVTLAKKYNVDEYALKRMVGHAIRDITEAVYTERDPNWLSTEIQKIK